MSVFNAWIFLLIAGFLEVFWAVGLKYTEGFSRLVPSILTVAALILSMFFLSKSTQVLPMSTAYGIWVGIGALGVALYGALFFEEPLTIARAVFLTLLLVSILGLKITAS